MNGPSVDDVLKAFSDLTKTMSNFLCKMYGIMIDPHNMGTLTVEEICRDLLEVAVSQRQREHDMREATQNLLRVAELAPGLGYEKDGRGSMTCSFCHQRAAFGDSTPHAPDCLQSAIEKVKTVFGIATPVVVEDPNA